MDNHAEPLPVARRESFARLIVAGRNQSDAYREREEARKRGCGGA